MNDPDYETMLAFQCQAIDLPAPKRQYLFGKPIKRKWRADFAWPDYHLLVEVQGWGRHQRWVGYESDCERMAWAIIMGWRMIWVTPAQVTTGQAVGWIERILKNDP